MQTFFKKIQNKKVSERVFDQLKELILSGKLMPGDKLPPERELSTLFGVSRSSLREAVLKLECLGFAEQKHGEGTFVRSCTEMPLQNYLEELSRKKDFFLDLMEIRNVLETWAASAAAARAEEWEVAAMRSTLGEMMEARESCRLDHKLNLKLHQQISAATHNRFLIHMMGSIAGSIEKVTHQLFDPNPYKEHEQEIHDHLFQQHTAIVDAIERRDAEKAFRAMESHLGFAGEMTRKSREKRGR